MPLAIQRNRRSARAFGADIRRLAGLAVLLVRICLVTGRDAIMERRDGRIRDRLDLLYGIRLPQTDRAWTWERAPVADASRDRRLLHGVFGFGD